MISFNHKGDFKKTEDFGKRVLNHNYRSILEQYARAGVSALSSNTPVDSGNTANAWSYEIREKKGSLRISWLNSNTHNGVPVAILIQYGHATKNGGYVQGRDFINPTLQPIFDKMANEIWREVTK